MDSSSPDRTGNRAKSTSKGKTDALHGGFRESDCLVGDYRAIPTEQLHMEQLHMEVLHMGLLHKE